MPDETLTYQSAGVDIDEAQRALRKVIGGIQSTHGPNVVGGIGGFGGLFRADFGEFKQPVLVSSIDGVGTKSKLAAMIDSFEGLGYDIVNHCVNDILCQGAKPLFFLDYYGTSHLNGMHFEGVLKGIIDACRMTGTALIGGETAEMPGVYHDEEMDIVGTVIGVVDFEKKLPRGKMKAGDAVIGLGSDGLHTNGYSLARRALFDMAGYSVRDVVPGLSTTIGDELLRPHRCYLNSVYPLLQEFDEIYAVAHITGGGLFDNIPRVVPSDRRLIIDRRAVTAPHNLK